MKHYPKIQPDSELSSSTDSDSSIDLDFGPPTPKVRIVSCDIVDDNTSVKDNDLINNDSMISDDSSDDVLGISVSSIVLHHSTYEKYDAPPPCLGHRVEELRTL